MAQNNPWYSMTWNYGSDRARIDIGDDIGMCDFQSAADFCRQLNSISAEAIDLHINSSGGSIMDGLEIFSAIKAHPATITAHVGSVAASIASVIAMACDKVCMSPVALMMIHNGYMDAAGAPDAIRKQADVLDKMCKNIAQIYADETGQKLETVQKAMDEETWYDAQEAMAFGLCDEIEQDDPDEDDPDEDGEELDARACAAALRAVAKYPKTPAKLRQFAARLADKQHHSPRILKESRMKAIARDGKFFATVNGQEVEIEMPAAAAGGAGAAAGAGGGGAAMQAVAGAVNQADLEKAKSDALQAGVQQERDYRKMFDTVKATAGLSAEAALEFDKFYGQPEAQLKFLASHAIALRAQPVGEQGAGNQEGNKTETQKSLETALAAATTRWGTDDRLRKMHGCLTANPTDEQYKLRLKRYLNAIEKNFTDRASGAGRDFDKIPDNDAISNALANKSMTYRM